MGRNNKFKEISITTLIMDSKTTPAEALIKAKIESYLKQVAAQDEMQIKADAKAEEWLPFIKEVVFIYNMTGNDKQFLRNMIKTLNVKTEIEARALCKLTSEFFYDLSRINEDWLPLLSDRCVSTPHKCEQNQKQWEDICTKLSINKI